ncbi:prepilin-type N-terminal cleavage/methylation domain-containing protein [Methylobacillus glycogenes]|uniref:prepilin-type N-terminal cleavage/methylation domain-containing protein n=1 Tax=Methylobacillus glycogenes TaxID=406 RepID=UPI0004711182|nr:prepilin-type N-terminal cleavage/methylation domain-containing protein [Methylobacillus glycogenes]
MKKSSGFTLIELAIVLVIIGLLLGGVLKGQELINSAKVKNLAADFKNVQVYVYAYQDKYRALPGDDGAADTHLGLAAEVVRPGNSNGVINGAWNSTELNAESVRFWQHVRLAGFAPGQTVAAAAADLYQMNSEGGRIGIQSVSGDAGIPSAPTAMTSGNVICSGAIQGKFAKQIDLTLDDGDTATGSVRAYATGVANWAPLTGAGAIADAQQYNVCMSF